MNSSSAADGRSQAGVVSVGGGAGGGVEARELACAATSVADD